MRSAHAAEAAASAVAKDSLQRRPPPDVFVMTSIRHGRTYTFTAQNDAAAGAAAAIMTRASTPKCFPEFRSGGGLAPLLSFPGTMYRNCNKCRNWGKI
jgi:hypothetical protein